MKISITELNKHFKKPLSTNDIITALEKTEVEVEEVISIKNLDKKIISAKVASVKKHPDSDRLNLAKINYGSNKVIEVVCGAPNLEEDQIVAFAQAGATLPSGDTIFKTKIRGVVSEGMLCSEKELGISDDHSGIAILDPNLPLGISLCDIEFYTDIVDIKTPSNRWDMLSINGLAREVFANHDSCELVEQPVKELRLEDKSQVKVGDKELCKRFMTAKIKVNGNVKSPDWLVDNLKAAGMRSINAVVDITNFVMLETGQPSHAYDASKLSGSLVVRKAKNNEELITLDGVKRKLQTKDLVIADGKGAIGIAGVIGGERTEVSDDTKEIILEVANFDKTTVRKSALEQKVRTEASSRFEKGLPLPLCEKAFSRLVYLLEDICGAKLIEKTINDQLYAWPWIQHIGLRVRKAEKFLGVKLEEKQLLNGLKRRGFEVEHFSIVKEARKHLGKPYKWGANFKQDGSSAFDCSYLIDYIYSLIGVYTGHTALAQFEHGKTVDEKELKSGDVVFYKGKIDKSAVDHFYILDENKKHIKQELKTKKEVGHNGIYIGNGRVIMAAQYKLDKGEWVKRPKAEVIEVKLEEFTKNPGYLGARRYVDNFNHIIAVTAPWWRNDIRIEEDIYEEVAKIVGYNNLPSTLPQLPPTPNYPHKTLTNIQFLKDILIGRGLFEVMTYSFISSQNLKMLKNTEQNNLKIVNPLSSEQEYLRDSLMMSHLSCLSLNSSYYKKEYGFFEISRVYEKLNNKKNKDEHWVLGITMVGKDSVKRLKSYIDTISQMYSWNVQYSKLNEDYMIDSRSCSLVVNNEKNGFYGQLSPRILSKLKVSSEVSYFETRLSSESLEFKPKAIQKAVPYQLIERDVTLEINNDVWWQSICGSLEKVKNIVKLEYIGDFSNKELEEKSKKRLSFKIVLDCGPQPTTDEIESELQKQIEALKHNKDLGKFIVC